MKNTERYIHGETIILPIHQEKKMPYSYYEKSAKSIAKYLDAVRTTRPEDYDAFLLIALYSAALTWDVDEQEIRKLGAVLRGEIK